jgi:undecaprenyl-diphosphatase
VRAAFDHGVYAMKGVDTSVLNFVVDHRNGVLTALSERLMDLGTSLVVLVGLAVLGAVYVVVARRWRFATSVALALVASTVAVNVLKEAIGRARPPARLALVHLVGPAMPSTHAARTAALATAAMATLTWPDRRMRRVISGALLSAVAIVGGAMVYLGGHWLTDVLAGWAIGAGIGLAAASIARAMPMGTAGRA